MLVNTFENSSIRFPSVAFEVYKVTLKKVMTEMTSKNGFSGNKGRHELMLVARWRKGDRD